MRALSLNDQLSYLVSEMLTLFYKPSTYNSNIGWGVCMKRLFIFMALIAVASPALANGCTRWFDAEGFERVKCEPGYPVAVPLLGTAAEAKAIPFEVHGYLPDVGQFTIYNRETKTIQNCQKHKEWVICK